MAGKFKKKKKKTINNNNIKQDAASSANPSVILNASLNVARQAGFALKQGGGVTCDIEETNPLASEDNLLDELASVIAMARFNYPVRDKDKQRSKQRSNNGNKATADIIGRLILAANFNINHVGYQARLSLIMYLVGALIGGEKNEKKKK